MGMGATYNHAFPPDFRSSTGCHLDEHTVADVARTVPPSTNCLAQGYEHKLVSANDDLDHGRAWDTRASCENLDKELKGIRAICCGVNSHHPCPAAET